MKQITPIAPPRVAVAHDAVLYLGGAERVFAAILHLFPTADVYTAFLVPEMRGWVGRYTSGNVFVSPFDRILCARRFADWFKPLLYFWWESLDLFRYDLVISSSHSFSAKSVIVPPGVIHVSYIHTPPRYLYDEHNETRWIRHPLANFLLKPVFSWMRKKDYAAAQRPDVLIASSQTVKERIRRYYRRDSVVVYPPVKMPRRLPKSAPKYFLCVSRLVKQKGVELAIQTCNMLRASLVIVGKGPQEARLRSLSGPTIIFRGWVPDEKMAQVYAGAKALIFPAIEEDFGIVPIEAMAHGVPVIAYNSGGLRETVIDGKTGVMFNNHTIESLIGAIKRFDGLRFSQQRLIDYVQQFSEKRFAQEFTNIVNKLFQGNTKQ